MAENPCQLNRGLYTGLWVQKGVLSLVHNDEQIVF